MADGADDIRDAVKNLAFSSPVMMAGQGIVKLGDMAAGIIPSATAAVKNLMPKAPMGDIELPKEPRLLGGSDKKVVAENIRLLINSGLPEDQAIMTAMRHSKRPSAP